ncbi:type II toxin-antitoxin system RelE family toxin [Neorhizobium sp. NPDC001467]|uniref:type II toxin-antitoxin system RelE family toxin n=1 Tax=Neorhizobium sp. NPDC001467 TaxID=3390595 RepID=UPI003CFBFA71
MNHHATAGFWDTYRRLPRHVQKLADTNFELLKTDPRHPSLHFKALGRFWSARVGKSWRALAIRQDDDFIWFWIGSHADYDKLVK